MKILPAGLEDQINRVDRQRSLYVGVGAALFAAWSAFRLMWLIYIALTFGTFMGVLAFQFLLWGVLGAAAAVVAFAFLSRCQRDS